MKREVKLFLTFFIIYSIYIHSVSWNEQTRLLSTISLVNESRLEIDSYANLTGDRIVYNNHYYSDKAPGTSFLLTPIYSLSKLFTSEEYRPTGEDKVFLPQPQFNTTIYTDISPGVTFQLTSILGTILLSSLPGALVVVLIYLILLNFTKNEKTSFITSIIFGLGTIIFSYSTVLMGNILPLLLILFAFYLSFIKENPSNKIYFLSGTLLGFSIVLDYLSIIFTLLFLIFQFLRIKKNILYLVLGTVLAILPLFIYNYFIFHNPLILSANFSDPQIFPDYQIRTNNRPVITTLWLLIFPYRGLFFYMPFLLLSFLGFKKLHRKDKRLSIFILLLFSVYLITNGVYSYWFGGSSFGSRYLLAAIAFLSIPLAYHLNTITKQHHKFIFIALVSISIFHMILGTSSYWEGLIFYKFDVTSIPVEWYGKPLLTVLANNIGKLNPLYEHYLPLFLDYGPRSRVLEYLFAKETPDIRDFKSPPVTETKLFTLVPLGISVLRIPFLSILILFVAISLIWRKELSRIFVGKKITIFQILLILIAILFISRIDFKEVVYYKNWYPVYLNVSYPREEMWIDEEASIVLYSLREEQQNILLEIGTFYKPREVEITVNEKPFNYTIFSYKEKIVVPSIKIKRGENVITFKSLSNCDKPYLLINTSEDPRCLSFVLHDIKGVPLPTKYNMIFDNNWYPEEQYIIWAYKSPSIVIKSNEKASAKLNLTLISYNKPRELGFVINDILFDIIRVETNRTNVITKTFPLKAGDNILKFIIEDCDIPAEIEKSDDRRCLSFGIISVKLVSPFILDKDIIFGPNWYEEEKDGGRWMSNKASIFLFSNTSRKAELSFDIATYKIDRTTRIYLNKGLIFEEKIKVDRIEKINFAMNLKEGENLLEIENDVPCQIPALIETSKDDRCLSFKLFNLVVD